MMKNRVQKILDINPSTLDEEIVFGDLSYLFQQHYLCKWKKEKEDFPFLKKISSWPHLVVEVGCGRGLYLMQRAAIEKETFFLGVEREGWRFKTAHARSIALNLDNLSIVKRDIVPLVAFNFPDESVDEYLFFYPDPWPKRRHRRRRWYRHPFIVEILRTLKTEGIITITSDELFYIKEAEWMLGNRFGLLIEYMGEVDSNDRRTHFEIKYKKQGRLLYEIRFRKDKIFSLEF